MTKKPRNTGRRSGSQSFVPTRFGGENDVHFMDMTPNQAYSVATSMIPFLDHDDATRALMGSNMQKQGVSCILPEAPLVGTGMEDRAARDVGRLIICENDGTAEYVDASKIIIKEEGKKKGHIIWPLFYGPTL